MWRRLRGVPQHAVAIGRGGWGYIAKKLRERKALDRAPQIEDAVMQFRSAVESATLRAVRSYRPSSFAGNLKLFLPSPAWARTHLALRWQSVASNTDVYYGGDGHTHDTMLLAPQVALYATLFRRARGASAARALPRSDPSIKLWLPDRGSNLGPAE
jgi:thioesterase domain-containing protein